MKKIGIILAVVAIAILASSFTFSPTNGEVVDVREVEVGGHKYVVATSIQLSSSGSNQRPGGVSIIHSAGCNCGKK